MTVTDHGSSVTGDDQDGGQPYLAIDLKPFCGIDPFRPYLHEPFTWGEWSYATNGHILVRIPHRGDVPENPRAPQPGKVFAKAGPIPALRVPPHVKFPEPATEDCGACDGRGHEHDCPDCECECELCDGTGSIVETITVAIGGVSFDAKYVRLLLALPNIRVAEQPPPSAAMWFVFDGGEGLLMPRREPAKRHIETEASPATVASDNGTPPNTDETKGGTP